MSAGEPTDPRVAALVAQISSITPVDERERDSIEALRERLTWPEDPFDEGTHPHHVTASAFVVSPRGVILHRHLRLGIWVQPGGHIDGAESPLAAALREVREETGLTTTALEESVFHVDRHAGPRAHTHYDLRYVLVSDGSDPSPPPGESPEVYWYGFHDAIERAEPMLRHALAKLARVTSGAERETLEP